jgi:hypothetical protein
MFESPSGDQYKEPSVEVEADGGMGFERNSQQRGGRRRNHVFGRARRAAAGCGRGFCQQ